MVKPVTQDASVGLDQRSVVSDQAALEARVAFLLQEYGAPVLVEEFIRLGIRRPDQARTG